MSVTSNNAAILPPALPPALPLSAATAHPEGNPQESSPNGTTTASEQSPSPKICFILKGVAATDTAVFCATTKTPQFQLLENKHLLRKKENKKLPVNIAGSLRAECPHLFGSGIEGEGEATNIVCKWFLGQVADGSVKIDVEGSVVVHTQQVRATVPADPTAHTQLVFFATEGKGVGVSWMEGDENWAVGDVVEMETTLDGLKPRAELVVTKVVPRMIRPVEPAMMPKLRVYQVR